MDSQHKLIDNTDKKRYEYHIDGHIPNVEYVKPRKGEIFLIHTEVPSQMRGQGIASKLVEDVLKDIERQNLILTPICPFTVWYISQNPQWKRLIKE